MTRRDLFTLVLGASVAQAPEVQTVVSEQLRPVLDFGEQTLLEVRRERKQLSTEKTE